MILGIVILKAELLKFCHLLGIPECPILSNNTFKKIYLLPEIFIESMDVCWDVLNGSRGS